MVKYLPATADNSAIIVMSPVLLSQGRGQPLQRYERAAIGLSTDLSQKINPDDVDNFLMLVYMDEEPTKKGSKRKIFAVSELSLEEIKELDATADQTHRLDPYRDPRKTPQAAAQATAPEVPF
jgi:hypothetical protein